MSKKFISIFDKLMLTLFGIVLIIVLIFIIIKPSDIFMSKNNKPSSSCISFVFKFKENKNSIILDKNTRLKISNNGDMTCTISEE
ncbi:hypothetical protein [Avibacterium avium]|uniref:hypothetical protein n=1 Tax=Avibacterium avium TaxID=751 RepID=UPI003BF8BD65